MTETLTAPAPVQSKRAGKIYQCDTPGYTLTVDNNDNPWKQENADDDREIFSAANLTFHPVTEPLTGKVFSELGADAPILAKKVQIVTDKHRDSEGKARGSRDATTEEIESLIENCKAFKDCQTFSTVGKRGIWLKSDRQKQLQAEVGTPGGVTPASVFDNMSDAVLKLHIETEGGTYPAEADHAKLVEIAAGLQKA